MGVTHRAPSLPLGWKLAPFPSTQRVRFSLSVVQNPAGIEAVWRHALRASNPADTMYGAYLSVDEVARKCAPSPDVLSVVYDWLVASRCGVAAANELLAVDCSVADAEALLNTSVHLATHVATGQSAQRMLDFRFPFEIDGLVSGH